MKLTLAFICQNETQILDEMLQSVAPHVSEIICGWTGTNPETKTILEKHNAKILDLLEDEDCWITMTPAILKRMKEIDKDFNTSELPAKLIHFAHARQKTFDGASNDLVLWLDSDDILLNGNNLKEITDQFKDPSLGAVWFPYLYDFDEGNRCVLELWRERIVNKKYYFWAGAVHETMLPKAEVNTYMSAKLQVKHRPLHERISNSAYRNLSISLAEYARQTIEACVDARTLYDLARSYNSSGKFDKALDFFDKYLEESNWDSERYTALMLQATIYIKFSQYEKAIEKMLAAVKIDPFRKDAYFKIAYVYFKQEMWDRTVYYTELGYNLPVKESILPQNPDELTSRPLLPFASALFNLQKFQEASLVAKKALEFYPENSWLKHAVTEWPVIAKQFKIRDQKIEMFNKILKLKENQYKQSRIKDFITDLPDFLKEDPFFIPQINKYFPSIIKDERRSIIFYCGQSHEYWNANSVKTGIGGSEEATIQLAKRLVTLGWRVTIYNNTITDEILDGVRYVPFFKYDQDSERCDIFIAWRHNQYASFAPKGAKKLVWLHDVQQEHYWSPDALKQIDLIMPLSKWHRLNLKSFKDDKFWVTRNGIDPSDFANRHSRDSKRIIYASSPDRGLDTLLEMWPFIKRKDPDAELHVFYGFTKTFDEVHKGNQKMRDWKDYVLGLLKQPGITYHGRVNHRQLAEEFMKSAIWCYPTNFTEISCITAMKAQASGAIPVCTTVAALSETVQHGFKISGPGGAIDQRTQKTFINLLIRLLKDNKLQDKIREPMMKWAKEFYSWEKLAKEWSQKFKELLGESRTNAISGKTTGTEVSPKSL